MNQPLFRNKKYGLMLTRDGVQRLIDYAGHFANDAHLKLSEYLQIIEIHPSAIVPETEILIEEGKAAIDEAQCTISELQALNESVAQLYRWNFVKLAEVLRQTRLQLKLDEIDQMYSLSVLTHNIMEMLKNENPSFDEKKFCSYINSTEEASERR